MNVAQPEQQVEGRSLMAEARSYGKAYWIRVAIGLLFVIFFAAWVPNAYLQWKYSDTFQESPCNLCQELNAQATAMCWNPGASYNRIETSMWTLHPIKELGFKARWLQIPCDVCAEAEGGRVGSCLNQTFHPELNNKKINGFSNLSFIPEGDISS